jgi:hypothetical protein
VAAQREFIEQNGRQQGMCNLFRLTKASPRKVSCLQTSAWVRIASSVQASAVIRLENKRTFRHACTLEAMRTQECSQRASEGKMLFWRSFLFFALFASFLAL